MLDAVLAIWSTILFASFVSIPRASKTNQTLTKIGEVGSKVESFGNGVTNVGKKVSVASATVTAMGGAAVKTAADFESSMSQVQATMGITKDSMSVSDWSWMPVTPVFSVLLLFQQSHAEGHRTVLVKSHPSAAVHLPVQPPS